ncbi:probable cytochrome P450 12c1, mitochondrial [Drosophila nasuta]|uniref:probable cytochrome P450 12c1, mitochondrial n=1 Tax=Drosophila nasuta TaxID=42062 RepID=UPI00295E441C|nr:probable cytochrome P450 12c1, mitochondrial [Drosophila nasuta]
MFRRPMKLVQCVAYSTRWRSTAAAVKIDAGDSSYMQQLKADWQTAKSYNDLPGPSRWRMFRGFLKGGEFTNLDMRELMFLLRNQYGDTFLLPGVFGMPDNVVTFNVENFEKTYRTEGQWPERPGADVVVHYRNNRPDGFFKDCIGLFSIGENWGQLRSKANPVLMQHRNAALYLQPMQRVNQQFIQRIRDIRDEQSQEVPGNFLRDINHLTFESIAVVALDRELGLLRHADQAPLAQKLFNNLQKFMQGFYELTIMPSVYKYVPTPKYKRFSNAMDEIFDVCSHYVNEAIKRIEQKPANATGTQSVLEQLLRVDRKFATVMSMDMLMGGVDTTSSALSGIMLNLAKNPEKQAKLREEIVAKLPHPTDEFKFNDMKSLPYLRAIIKESMRIYPVVFGNLRSTGADIVLDGYRIPKGTRVLMNSNLLLDDERYYPRAKEFLPERWLREQSNENEKLVVDNPSPFVYLPFGFGPRMCVGKRIVDMEMEITVSNLVRNFNIEYNYPTENAFRITFINSPVIPLKFKFTDIKY